MGISSLKNVLVKIEEAVLEKKPADINKYFTVAKSIAANSSNSLIDILKELS